jgi:hypothetical protein
MANVEIVLEAVDRASGVIGSAGRALSGLGDIAGQIAKVGLAAAAAGATALAGGLAFSIAQAMEGEKILARLDSVIKSTGGAAGLTSEAAQALATRFMDLAGGSDDAVLAIQEMALRMGTITAQQMPDFIQTTLDMAAATGTDAVNAARLLAQAQEDPISALTRFRRMGIQFTEAQEEQIKTLMESGDAAGAFALVMDRLGEATGGAAAAAAGTVAGQFEILKGRLGEAAETIGAAFLPVLHELFDNVLAPAIPVIEAVAAQFAERIPAALEQARTVFEALQGQAAGAVTALQPVIDAARNVAQTFIESMPMVQASVQQMVDFVLEQIGILSPTLIANVSETLNQLATFWRNHGDEIMAVVSVAFEFITVTVGGALTLLSGLVASALALINGDTATATETMKTTWVTFMDSVLSIVGKDLDTFIADWTGTFELAKVITTTLWGQLKDTIAAKLMEITGGVQQFIIDVINAFQGTDWDALGSGIIDGIASGIRGAVGGLVAAAAGAALSAFNAAKDALGIHSPSTLFAGIGANMMQGMAQGISANAGLPAMATAQAAASTVSTVNNYWTVNASYPYQSASSVAQELRLRSLLDTR